AAVRARAGAAPGPPHAGPGHDAARARAAFRHHPGRRGVRARADRLALSRDTRPSEPRATPRAAVRAGTRGRPARPPAGLVGAPAAVTPTTPGPTLDGMDDVYDLYQRGMALLEDGHYHQAAVPLA